MEASDDEHISPSRQNSVPRTRADHEAIPSWWLRPKTHDSGQSRTEETDECHEKADSAPNPRQQHRFLGSDIRSQEEIEESANEILLQNRFWLRNTPQGSFPIGQDAIPRSRQPEDFSRSVEDDDTPEHPVLRTEPADGHPDCDDGMSKVYQIGETMVQPTA